jgi:hypothetical protein
MSADSSGVSVGETKKEFRDPWDTEPKTKTKRKRRRPGRGRAISPIRAGGATKTISVASTAPCTAPAEPATGQHGGESHQASTKISFRLQLVATDDNGNDEIVDVTTMTKGIEGPEHIGLTLADSKDLLRKIQRVVVERQVEAYLNGRSACDHCGKPLSNKGWKSLLLHTLFGKVSLKNPRLRRCSCTSWETKSFRPLRDLIPETTTPELLFLESKWSALVSYALAAKALRELLPVNERIGAETVRRHTMRVAERCETDLEQSAYELPKAEPHEDGLPQRQDTAAVNVNIDSTYLRLWKHRGHKFEILVGRSDPPTVPAKCFGTVQKTDPYAQYRLCEVLTSQGINDGYRVCVIADGEDAMRRAQRALVPDAENLLDWFHLTMRLTGLRQFTRGVVTLEKNMGEYGKNSNAHRMQRAWTSTKWKLWHGKVDDALVRLARLRRCIVRTKGVYRRYRGFLNAADDLRRYVTRNRDMIHNYGKRWRNGLVISTASIESLVGSIINRRFAKKQKMAWTPGGAHNLLQIRTKVANDDLAAVFADWYPDFPAADHTAPGSRTIRLEAA